MHLALHRFVADVKADAAVVSRWLERRRSKLIDYANRQIVFYLYRVTGKEKCPGCGSRQKHVFKFNPVYQKVIHRCAVCEAEWGQMPIVIADQWVIIPVQQQVTRAPLVHEQ